MTRLISLFDDAENPEGSAALTYPVEDVKRGLTLNRVLPARRVPRIHREPYAIVRQLVTNRFRVRDADLRRGHVWVAFNGRTPHHVSFELREQWVGIRRRADLQVVDQTAGRTAWYMFSERANGISIYTESGYAQLELGSRDSVRIGDRDYATVAEGVQAAAGTRIAHAITVENLAVGMEVLIAELER